MPETDRPYTLLVGGAVLMKDGQVATVAEPAVVYQRLRYKHVQALWRALGSEEVRAAAHAYSNVVARVMTELGDRFGIQSGKMTAEELTEVFRLAEDRLVDKE